MRIWRAKQKAPREAPVQLRVSREDKGKMPLNLGGIADANREAKLTSLSSPDPGALVPSANLTPMSEIKGASLNTDGVANAVSVSKGTNKIPNCEAETEALCSAKYLRNKARSGAPLRAKSEVTMTSLPKFSGAKLAPGGGATCLTSPSEVNIIDKVIFKSLKNRSLKARGLQPEQTNTRSCFPLCLQRGKLTKKRV